MPERLALTSALVGEGVTYVTRSLAAAIAYDTDASVVIVDLTFRRPPTANGGRRRGRTDAAEPARPAAPAPETVEVVEAEGETEGETDVDGEQIDAEVVVEEPVAEEPRRTQPTMADAIEHDAKLDDIIITTSNPRLCLVQAGNVPVARRPALAQGRPLANVLDQLDERFDHVLLDLPPVLASSDAMNLSQLADAYVLVVRQGATSEGQVDAALQELAGGETLGVILNRFDSNIPRRLRRLVGT